MNKSETVEALQALSRNRGNVRYYLRRLSEFDIEYSMFFDRLNGPFLNPAGAYPLDGETRDLARIL